MYDCPSQGTSQYTCMTAPPRRLISWRNKLKDIDIEIWYSLDSWWFSILYYKRSVIMLTSCTLCVCADIIQTCTVYVLTSFRRVLCMCWHHSDVYCVCADIIQTCTVYVLTSFRHVLCMCWHHSDMYCVFADIIQTCTVYVLTSFRHVLYVCWHHSDVYVCVCLSVISLWNLSYVCHTFPSHVYKVYIIYNIFISYTFIIKVEIELWFYCI